MITPRFTISDQTLVPSLTANASPPFLLSIDATSKFVRKTTSIPVGMLPANVALKDAANTFTVGGQVIQTGAAATVGLLVSGVAAQSANLTEWRDSSSTLLMSVSSAGNVAIRPTTGATASLSVGADGGTGSAATLTTSINARGTLTLSGQSQTAFAYGSASTTTNVPRAGAGFGANTNGAATTVGCLAASSGGGTYLNFSTNGGATGLHVTHNHGSDLLSMTSAGVTTLRSTGVFGWTASADANLTPDTTLVRSAAGVVGIYDNAAGGAGTAVGLRFQRASSTTAQRDAANISGTLSITTDASRRGQLTIGVYEVSTLLTALTITAAPSQPFIVTGGNIYAPNGIGYISRNTAAGDGLSMLCDGGNNCQVRNVHTAGSFYVGMSNVSNTTGALFMQTAGASRANINGTGVFTITPDGTNAIFQANTTGVGFFAVTPVARSTGWAVTNPVTRKTFDTTTVTLPQLAEVVGTLIDYLKTLGPLGA